jgi:hypothetical protein
MAYEAYKHHLLIWKACHDPATNSWFGCGSISWKIGAQNYSYPLEGPHQDSEDLAISQWKQIAENWIDGKS